MAASKYDIQLDLAGAPDTSHAYMVDLVGSNKRVLDVGCATGYLGRALTALGNTVAGVECDEAAAEQARAYLERVVVADLESVDLAETFDEGSFDVVVFGDVLEHLRRPIDVLRQARPLLKPGGCAVISVPNVAHGDVRLALLQGRFEYHNLGLLDETHLRFFTRESLATFLSDAGFVAVDIRRTTAPLFSTEISVRKDEFDPALIARIEADPDATTYQFVVRAVRDDAARAEAEMMARIEQQYMRIHELERRVGQLTEQRDDSGAQVEAKRHELDDQRQRVARLQEELDRLRQMPVVRAARLARTAWRRFSR